MKFMLKFFGRLLFLLFIFPLVGKGQDSLKVSKADSLKLKPTPAYLSLGVDLSRIFLSSMNLPFNGLESSVDYRKGPISGQFHFGYVSHSKPLKQYSAASDGFYLLGGVAKNLISDPENVLGFGLRLGLSSYTYKVSDAVVSYFPGNETRNLNFPAGSNLVSWVEFVGTVKTRVTGMIMMGLEVRLKTRIWEKYDGFPPYFSPGYGLSRNGFNPGLNYFLFIQIPKGKGHVSKVN